MVEKLRAMLRKILNVLLHRPGGGDTSPRGRRAAVMNEPERPAPLRVDEGDTHSTPPDESDLADAGASERDEGDTEPGRPG